MEILPTQSPSHGVLHLVIGWQVFAVLPLMFFTCRYILHNNGLGGDWAVGLVMLYPYVALALYTMFRLQRDPPSGRRVALLVPCLLLGFDLLTLYIAFMSVWGDFRFFLFYWGMNLLYALYSVPVMILLLLPAVKRRCCAESEFAESVHLEADKESLRHWRCVISRVLASMGLVLIAIYAGILTPYFFSVRLAESKAPKHRSRIVVVAYDMYGKENVGIYCWSHGRLLPQRIKVVTSSGDTWCYPGAEITWVGNTSTISVIGESDTNTFVYMPE